MTVAEMLAWGLRLGRLVDCDREELLVSIRLISYADEHKYARSRSVIISEGKGADHMLNE